LMFFPSPVLLQSNLNTEQANSCNSLPINVVTCGCSLLYCYTVY
jgi:hypothetical protein